MSDVVVICGLSGAGRSQAANALEDLGWFVIDNVPPALIPKVGELVGQPGSAFERVALVVRSGPWESELQPALEALDATVRRVRVVFLDSSTPTLVRRYGDTRRRHPLADAGATVGDAIERERALLQPLKGRADVVVDTTALNVHELKARMGELFAADSPGAGMRVNIVSFGYKHGVPVDVDLVFDCRFLPNPHWVDDLRPLTGADPAVRAYVLEQPAAKEFVDRLDGMLGLLLPAYVQEGKAYLTIAVGCTGGRHRSVVLAERLAELVREHGFSPTVTHRDVAR